MSQKGLRGKPAPDQLFLLSQCVMLILKILSTLEIWYLTSNALKEQEYILNMLNGDRNIECKLTKINKGSNKVIGLYLLDGDLQDLKESL